MDLTTTARVNALMGWTSGDAANDALIASLISSISARVENLFACHTEQTSRTEVYKVRLHQGRVSLRGYPVTVIGDIKYTNDGVWASADALATTDYILDSELGVIDLLIETEYDPGELQVTYTGGLAANTAGFVAAFPDVAYAVDAQIVNILQRRGSVGGNAMFEGGKILSMKELGDLRALEETVCLHRRVMI